MTNPTVHDRLRTVRGIGGSLAARIVEALPELRVDRAASRRLPAIVFDIETGPDPAVWEDPARVEEIRSGIEAPSNYKDPVKIAAAVDEKLATMKARAALHPALGRVRCIGWALLDSDDEPEVFVSEDESLVLGDFAARLDQVGPAALSGFAVRDFDIPWIAARAAVHDVLLPAWWPHSRDYRRVADARDVLTEGKLADWLAALGLPGKTSDGAASIEMPLDELADYCRQDVRVERLLLRRIRDRFDALRLTRD
jgi:hypothetical protein